MKLNQGLTLPKAGLEISPGLEWFQTHFAAFPSVLILCTHNTHKLHIIIGTSMQVLYLIAYILMPFGESAHHEDRAATMAVRNAGNEEVTSNSTWLKGEGVHPPVLGVLCVSCLRVSAGQRWQGCWLVVVVLGFEVVIGNCLNGWSQSVSARGCQREKNTQGCTGG